MTTQSSETTHKDRELEWKVIKTNNTNMPKVLGKRTNKALCQHGDVRGRLTGQSSQVVWMSQQQRRKIFQKEQSHTCMVWGIRSSTWLGIKVQRHEGNLVNWLEAW